MDQYNRVNSRLNNPHNSYNKPSQFSRGTSSNIDNNQTVELRKVPCKRKLPDTEEIDTKHPRLASYIVTSSNKTYSNFSKDAEAKTKFATKTPYTIEKITRDIQNNKPLAIQVITNILSSYIYNNISDYDRKDLYPVLETIFDVIDNEHECGARFFNRLLLLLLQNKFLFDMTNINIIKTQNNLKHQKVCQKIADIILKKFIIDNNMEAVNILLNRLYEFPECKQKNKAIDDLNKHFNIQVNN